MLINLYLVCFAMYLSGSLVATEELLIILSTFLLVDSAFLLIKKYGFISINLFISDLYDFFKYLYSINSFLMLKLVLLYILRSFLVSDLYALYNFYITNLLNIFLYKLLLVQNFLYKYSLFNNLHTFLDSLFAFKMVNIFHIVK